MKDRIIDHGLHCPRRRILKAILFVPSLVITIASAAFSQSEDGASVQPKQELDQPKRKGLTLSPDGDLAAELIVLFGNEGPGSLIKIWSVNPRELLQQFRVPGTAHVCAFSPDGSTLVTADITGNLARESTIRAWDLSKGTGRELDTCIGRICKFVFTGDGSQLAALVEVGLLEAFPLQEETGVACVSQVKVWQLADEREVLNINIADPRGAKVALWPPVRGAEARKRFGEVVRKFVPKELSFSSDGQQLITKTDAGLRTVYNSQTGKTLSSQTSVAQASDKWDEEAAQK